jgi:hypothetical protein
MPVLPMANAPLQRQVQPTTQSGRRLLYCAMALPDNLCLGGVPPIQGASSSASADDLNGQRLAT